MPKGEYRTYRDKAEALERELTAIKSRGDDHDVTINYLLTSAEAFIEAAKTLIEIRLKAETEPKPAA